MDLSTTDRPGINRVLVAVLCLAVVALAARAILSSEPGMGWWSAGLLAAYLILFLTGWWPSFPSHLVHAVFALQCAIVLALFSLDPNHDFITALFVPLCYQAVVVLSGRMRWVWVAAFVALIGVSLAFFLGPLRGLAMGLTSMAIGIVLPAAYLAATEIAAARSRSQLTLAELEETNEQLQAYAQQVAELVVLEERNRLSRELHDSVSQTVFTTLLTAGSARLLLDRDAARARDQMGKLQVLTQGALDQMRSLIAHLRPQS
jgi:signal transduction histidine kinase